MFTLNANIALALTISTRPARPMPNNTQSFADIRFRTCLHIMYNVYTFNVRTLYKQTKYERHDDMHNYRQGFVVLRAIH